MKKTFLLFILLIGFQFSNAQGFEYTEKYMTVTEIKENGSDHPAYIIDLVRSGGISGKLSTITIEDTELFEDIFISTLENPGLKGVSEVIKMEVEYLSCCAEVQSYYFLVKDNKEVVSLPALTNIYCENTNADEQYTFPNQKHGSEGTILETQTFYKNETTEIEYINLKQQLTWDDSNSSFKRSKKNTALTSN